MDQFEISEIKRVFHLNRPLLILGETGTGKSHFAKHLYQQMAVKGAFVHINISAINPELIESELFGHAKGSFSGALNEYAGKFEAAENGILFLDEIGEIPLKLQAKLLTFLDDFTYYPVGSNRAKKFKGHLICATNKDLDNMVENGEFREDLYYRLRNFQCELRPLRGDYSKVEDALNREWRRLFRGQDFAYRCSDGLWQFLLHYDWPGNYRELKSVVEFLSLKSEETQFRLEHLPGWIKRSTEVERKSESVQKVISVCDYRTALEEFEKNFLIQQLLANSWRINQTAREIGISKTTLIYKARKYNLKKVS